MQMVHLSRLYTRSGDFGLTSLGDGSRVSKTDSRLIAYADVDEANSTLGAALSQAASADELGLVSELQLVQNRLFDVGADLCTPLRINYRHPPIRTKAEWIDALEILIDEHNAELPQLASFVIPGGSSFVAGIHVARTVVRRAERSVFSAIETYGTNPSDEPGKGGLNPLTAKYLNRLSDYLFVIARKLSVKSNTEIVWKPAPKNNAPTER